MHARTDLAWRRQFLHRKLRNESSQDFRRVHETSKACTRRIDRPFAVRPDTTPEGPHGSRRITGGPGPSISWAREAPGALADPVARESRHARDPRRPWPRMATPRFWSIREMAPISDAAVEIGS